MQMLARARENAHGHNVVRGRVGEREVKGRAGFANLLGDSRSPSRFALHKSRTDRHSYRKSLLDIIGVLRYMRTEVFNDLVCRTGLRTLVSEMRDYRSLSRYMGQSKGKVGQACTVSEVCSSRNGLLRSG